VKLVIDILL